MTVTFFTNFINHHQVPLADEMYSILGDKYTFVVTKPMSESFKSGGYTDFSDKPYLLESFSSEQSYNRALELGLSSDIVIIGDAPDLFIKERLKCNKHTFRYDERWFKKGFKIKYISPIYWLSMFRSHTIYRGSNLYMLCAGAYTAKDTRRLFSYPNKCYKWGYFTKIEDIDITKIVESKRGSKIKFLWCARFLKLKHPELPLLLARRLLDDGFDNFEINMLGSGKECDKTVQLSKRLDIGDHVKFMGNMPNDEVLDMMKNHHIFLFTSNRREGWGAVLNEAMSSGCAVVSSNKIGASPFLINHDENGMIFKSGDIDSLYLSVKRLIDNEEHREKLSIAGYHTLKYVWSPINAANNFLKLANSKLNNEKCKIESGPCSIAEILSMKME